MGVLRKTVQQNLGGCQMKAGKEERVKSGTKEGFMPGAGVNDLTTKGSFTGASNTEEQQLQIQKGEQRSSLQVLECWSWSEES